MSAPSPPTHPFQRLVRLVSGWPRLFIAGVIATVVFFASLILDAPLLRSVILAWDAGVIFFLAAAALLMIGDDPADIRLRAARQDVGERVILTVTALAALASVGAIYAELSVGHSGSLWPIALAVGTFVLSWFFIHTFFAFHYAHEFYGRDENAKPGGLLFPGGLLEPEYADFFYLAIVIGMTSQVSDVAILDRGIRRTVTAHGLIAFFFNVALLALVVNIAADAIKPS